MTVTDDKLLLLKSHVCSRGLSEIALQEIADASELVQLSSGDYLHRASQPLSSVYLIVHGRLKQVAVDIFGNPLRQRFLTRRTQFGAMGGAQEDPIPVEIIAVELPRQKTHSGTHEEVDAWIAVTDPPDWTVDQTQQLKQEFAE